MLKVLCNFSSELFDFSPFLSESKRLKQKISRKNIYSDKRNKTSEIMTREKKTSETKISKATSKRS